LTLTRLIGLLRLLKELYSSELPQARNIG